MHSKNKKPMTKTEREHVTRVKEQDCVVCDASGPTEAHEIKQGLWFCSVSLCTHCHRGPMGLHGDKTLWRIHKMTEIEALNITLKRISA